MSETTAELEQAIRDALHRITNHWDALAAVATNIGAKPAGGPRGAASTRGVPAHDPVNDPLGVMVTDDHLDTDADIDRLTKVVSLRRYATDVLNGWSRVVMEDRPIMKALPDGTNVPSMAVFLDTHAQWMSGHDAAGDMLDELTSLGRAIQALAAPKRREYVYLGDCPFVVEDWFCGGRVRSKIGGDGTAACTDCGQETEVGWWEDVLGLSQPPVTLPHLVPILHRTLGLTVTDRTLRNWRRDGIFTSYPEPFGPAPKWDRYDPRVVLDAIARMYRHCPMCGGLWHGHGDVCTRCFAAMQTAQPRYAEPKTHTPTAMRLTGWCPWPRHVVANPHDTDRPDRCHFSDLPINQCACGRQHTGGAA